MKASNGMTDYDRVELLRWAIHNLGAVASALDTGRVHGPGAR